MRIAEEATTRRRARWSVAVSGIRKLRIASSVAVLSVQYGALFGPLVVWLLNRDDPYVEAQAKDALNFNISFFLYGLVAAISIIVLVGIFRPPRRHCYLVCAGDRGVGESSQRQELPVSLDYPVRLLNAVEQVTRKPHITALMGG